ncbi:MAG: GHKL domain-containing protein [Bacteroidetes bacterium]|nr:MAG: GHKL domain-containing protein [Bacteroidota bacterium]
MSLPSTQRPPVDELITDLRQFQEFAKVPQEVLHWLLDKSEYLTCAVGDELFYPGMPTNHMQIILSGTYRTLFPQGGELKDMGLTEAPAITGLLPFSRMKEARAYGKAVEPLRVLRLHRDYFIEMVNVSYDLVQTLVGNMSDRVRNFTQLRLQDEKLMSLGKLSAGLAHELNNPAAAIVRSVESLYQQIHHTPDDFKAVISMKITPEETDRVNAILFAQLAKEPTYADLGLMAQEAHKDEVIGWLEDHDIPDAEEIADVLVEFDFEEHQLDDIAKILDPAALGPVLKWIRDVLNMEKMVAEIKDAADRIAGLIASVKAYSHMDQAKDRQPMNIHDGIKSTLIMLKHKLKQKRIKLDKEFATDLPLVPIYPGEMNQVWTNLIDNAIDAMPPQGTLRIKTWQRHDYVNVQITDSGEGIPEELMNKIFDPFFTTKPVGQGTGLGLEVTRRIVVERHKGSIDVESEPGKTAFTVYLPVS